MRRLLAGALIVVGWLVEVAYGLLLFVAFLVGVNALLDRYSARIPGWLGWGIILLGWGAGTLLIGIGALLQDEDAG